MEPRTPELEYYEYLATVEAWVAMRDRRIRRRRALRWFIPLPLASVAHRPPAGAW